MHASFSSTDFHTICDTLAAHDKDLLSIMEAYGYPPMWNRPNTFETLVHIILEQQVSLASALAALNKLREKVTIITPDAVLRLTDEELKACYFSRQKTMYVRHLAEALLHKKINLAAMQVLPNDEIRATLSQLKGVGNWTIDIYLIFVLQRTDIFPMGDLAAVNALKQLKQLPKDISRDDLPGLIAQWAPYRTIATMLLWHYYLSLRVKKPRAGQPIYPGLTLT